MRTWTLTKTTCWNWWPPPISSNWMAYSAFVNPGARPWWIWTISSPCTYTQRYDRVPYLAAWRLPYLHIQEFALIGSLVIVVLSCFNNGRSTTPSNCWNSARVSYCRTWSLCWLTTTQSAVWFSVRNCTITTSWPACCWRCRLALKAARSTKNKH